MEQETFFHGQTRYFIGAASADHVRRAVEGGYAQFCHGKLWPTRRLSRGDGVIYYSSRERYGDEEPCRAFTAIGQIIDDAPYPVPGRTVLYRRQVRYQPCVRTPIGGLIPQLSFTKIRSWSLRLRVGIIEINAADFTVIKNALGKAELTIG